MKRMLLIIIGGMAAMGLPIHGMHTFSDLRKAYADYFAAHQADATTKSPITKDMFVAAKKGFTASFQQLAMMERWVTPSDELHNKVGMPQFNPYVQRLSVKPGDKVAVFGDLHSDAPALLNALDKKFEEKVFTDDFVLADGNYFVFLGDYTDREKYGVEVLTMLFKFKTANPDRVMVLRGNHEDGCVNENYGFGDELKAKFWLEPGARKKWYSSMYEVLPVALYVGSGDEYVLLCHGSLDAGFDPKPLLTADPSKKFMELGVLKRDTALKNISSVDHMILGIEGCDRRPEQISDLHFVWGDFTPSLKTVASDRFPDDYARFMWTYGAMLTATVLDCDKVRAIIRGHQHDFGKEQRSLWGGLVTTIMSFRKDTETGLRMCDRYSFLNLSIGDGFARWRLEHDKDGNVEQLRLPIIAAHGRAESSHSA